MPGHRPYKIRRTLETPAREVSKEKQETFLQVFNRFMKARAPPKVVKEVRGTTLVKTKIRRIVQGILGPKATSGQPKGKRSKAGEKDKEPASDKQRRIQEYFEKKAKVQLPTDQGLGKDSKNMGATPSSPLLGVLGSPGLKTPSKEDRDPRPEERGGVGD